MKKNNAFTLIELLIVISIIGVLVALSLFGLIGVRESARDARRKSDLELLRSGLEMYKADCNSYPASIPAAGSPLVGCVASNTYVTSVPADPVSTGRNYKYVQLNSGSGYALCAALERDDLAATTCGGAAASSCGSNCNYQITNP